MNLPISLYVALRYWRAKSADRFGRLVANLASFGIVLGVMALIIVLSVMNGLEGHQKQQVLSSIPHAIVSQDAPISAEKPLENIPHFVQKAVPINTTNVVFQTAKGVSAGPNGVYWLFSVIIKRTLSPTTKPNFCANVSPIINLNSPCGKSWLN